ncbi:MAG: hypothetical protein RLY16_1636, partial [Bacteroidota bacterium]
IRNLNFIGANKLAINLVNSSSDFIENCNISFSGESAIFGSTVTNLTATGNTIYYSNNNGIDLDNTNNSNCFIRNNSIRLSGINFGMSGPSARASMIGIATTGSGHQIENNTIDSTGFCGIWFFRGSNILIKNNFVNTYCFNKDDGGGIYTWNNYPVPTTYTNNKIISNIIMNGIGASLSTNAPNYLDCDGLMLDDNTGNIEVSDNTVANVPGNGLYIHNSFNVIARGNTVFNAGRTQLNYTHNLAFINGVSSPYTTPLRNITLKNNVFVSKNLGQLAFSNSSIRNDLDSTGIADSNYFARPIDDKLTIYTSRVVNGITTASNINLENWKLLFNKDLQSKKSSRTIPAYKITSLSTNIVATIGDFSTSVNGISAYSPNNNQVLRWDSNNLLNGSGSLMLSFPAIVSGVYTSLYTPIGSISSSKNYILRFSTLGTTDTGRIRVYLRKSATPFTTLTPLQYQSYGKTRIDHEFLFTAPTTDAAAVFIIEVQQSSGTTYIDNIQFYDATIVNTNPDDYLRFEYNPTTVNKVVALPKNYVSVEGVTYSNSITLAPFTSKVLILDTSLQVNATATAIKCFGGTSTVTVTATGGTAPYTGIGTFSTTAGTYSYTVRDANGVSASQTITIVQPTLLRGVATAGTIATYGGTTTVTVSASGGTAPYTGTGTFTVSAGTYSYTVTDANNCTFTTTLTISQPPPPLSIGLSATSINCFGGSAVVTVSAVGGTAPFTGTGNFNVTAGTYTYTITDAAGLTASSSITVNQPTLLSSTVSAGTITAFGGTTTVTVSATGGTAPYTGTGTFTVSAGTYTYTVTDAKNCTNTKTISISQPPPPLSIGLSATSINCFGGSAVVTVSAVGGTAPFTGTGNFNVTAGTYTYTITDAAGLTTSSSITVNQPTLLSSTVSAGTITAFGGTTTVTVSATGGTAPYTGTGTFTVSAGTYTYTVTDAKNCTSTKTITVTQPLPPLSIALSATNISCFGGSAIVTVSAVGGTAPFTGTGNFNVSAGTYNYTIRDAAGLTASSSITITQPTALAAIATVATNSNSDGTTNITVTATGGTAPYTGTGIFARTPGTYNFIITDAKGCTTTASATIIASSPLLLTHQTSPILCFGDSATVVINATGGMAPYTGTGTLKIGGNRGSLKLSFNSIISNLYSLLYAPIGAVSPQKKYVLNFTTLGTNANGVIRAALRQTNSPWGIITGYQTRNFGTSRTEHHFEFVPNSNETSASILIEVLQNAETVYIDNIAFFEADAAFNLISSNLFPSGNFDASIAGITAWSQNANHVAVWDSTSKISSVHYFTVTDALGSRTVDSVVIFNPPTPLTMTESHSDIIRFGDSSSVSITASGGVAPYTGIGKFNVAAGTYTFVVTDANGCSVSKTVTITQPVLFTSGTIATKVNCFADSSTVIVTGYGGNAPYRGNGSFRVLPGRNSLRLIFPTSVSNMYTFIYAPVGSISSTKNYSLRFSTKGSTGTGTLRAALRQTNSPWAYISTVQTASFGTAITQHEFRINAPTSEAAASFVIEVLQNSGTTYINNIALYEINADGSLSGNNLVQNGGNFENGISNVTVWSQNTNQVASADTMHIIPNRYYYTISDAANVTSVSWVDILRPTSLVVKSSAPAIPRTGGSTTVTVTATGGTAPYTGTGSFVRTAGKYTFTVTDANGCTGKTTITTAVGVATNGARVNLGDATLAMANKLNATLYPNPTQQHFNIRVQSNNLADKVTVRVWGYDGKLLIETSGSALQTYQLGDRLPSGIYNIQVLQGAESLQFKAIKAR